MYKGVCSVYILINEKNIFEKMKDVLTSQLQRKVYEFVPHMFLTAQN